MFKKVLPISIIALAAAVVLWPKTGDIAINNPIGLSIPTVAPTITPSPTPYPLIEASSQKVLPNGSHSYQTFNNCGPAALSMALSYYGISESQEALGQELRPFQNQQGDNDDKSVTLEELAEKSKDYGFIPYHRPGGGSDLIKGFIAYDIPVIARTLLYLDQDIGHYRVVKGYDDATEKFIQDDSLQGRDLRYSYFDFDALWKQFNYEYLVLVPKEKQKIAEAILGEDVDEKTAWGKAVGRARTQLENNPNDIYARFNLSVALYNVGNYRGSVDEFEKIENLLPFRTLWYQIEPIEAYFALADYERVFALTDKILNNYNRAFSELYILRGQIYEKQGNPEAARAEFDKAIFYNKYLKWTF